MWQVVESNEFRKWLDKLPREKLAASTKLVLFLQKLGLHIGFPHSRSLGKGLFELRDQQFGIRVYYTFSGKQIILLLNGGDKSSQEKDIERSRSIMKRYEGK